MQIHGNGPWGVVFPREGAAGLPSSLAHSIGTRWESMRFKGTDGEEYAIGVKIDRLFGRFWGIVTKKLDTFVTSGGAIYEIWSQWVD